MSCIDDVGLTLVWHCFCLSRSNMLTSAQRTLSWRHLYLPWPIAVLHPASVCTIVPLPRHSLHSWSALIPQVRWWWKGIIHWSEQERDAKGLQSSGHVIFGFGRSHIVQAPRDPNSTALDLHLSSSRCRTSASLLCLGSAFPHWRKWVDPSACLPPYARVPDDIPQLQRAFSLCHWCVSCPFALCRPELFNHWW